MAGGTTRSRAGRRCGHEHRRVKYDNYYLRGRRAGKPERHHTGKRNAWKGTRKQRANRSPRKPGGPHRAFSFHFPSLGFGLVFVVAASGGAFRYPRSTSQSQTRQRLTDPIRRAGSSLRRNCTGVRVCAWRPTRRGVHVQLDTSTVRDRHRLVDHGTCVSTCIFSTNSIACGRPGTRQSGRAMMMLDFIFSYYCILFSPQNCDIPPPRCT